MPDPLHGVTLEALLESLVERHGWEALGRAVPIRCFLHDPTVASSLKFLRKTPWARAKVEALYVRDAEQAARKRERNRKRNEKRTARRMFASLPVERPDTLAFTWPPDHRAPPAEVPTGITLATGIDRTAFIQVQQAIGFHVTDATWDTLTFVPGAMVVAHAAPGPVAVAALEPRDGGWTELSWVAVAPAYRGRGLGRAVCTELVEVALGAGHRHIVGSTPDDRIHALKLYLRMGFRPVERPHKQERWAAVRARLSPADGSSRP